MRPEKERERRGLSVVVASCSAPMVVERERERDEREVTKIFWREEKNCNQTPSNNNSIISKRFKKWVLNICYEAKV